MSGSRNVMRALALALTLSLAAGCAEQRSSHSQPMAAAAVDPELVGAWYQIYFDTNSAEINSRGQMIVRNVANVVANAGPTRVTIIGKTDRVGAPPANMALAERRANTVRDALITAGVPATGIDTGWTGEGRQEVSTADDTAEPRNRIVDITVVKIPR